MLKNNASLLQKLISSTLLCALFITSASQIALASPARNHNEFEVQKEYCESLFVNNDGKKNATAALSRPTLAFEAKKSGKSNSDFIVRASDYSLLIKPTQAVFAFPKKQNEQEMQRSTLRMKLLGANNADAIRSEGLDPQAGKVNYLVGNNEENWQINRQLFDRVQFSDVYRGINLLYYGNVQQQLEYDFIVSPGADYKQIKLRFDGAEKIEIEPKSGDLLVSTKAGVLRQHRPIIYQETEAGERQAIEGNFIKAAQNEISFEVAEYDKTRKLVIDPTLAYSTYLGGGGEDIGSAIAVDAAGNTYVTGTTNLFDFPTKNPFQPTQNGYRSAFITKISSTGQLVYSTYLGGNGYTLGNAIAVDSAGNVYVTGSVRGSFPLKNPLQSVYGGGRKSGDAFITKLSADGQQLVYSTYLGGSMNDSGSGIAVDAAGNAYISGNTTSTNFPTKNALQPAFGGFGSFYGDAFVARINASGRQLVYSSYLGGTLDDVSSALAVDSTGNAYVTGFTSSGNFPTRNALKPTLTYNDSDAFVSKINSGGRLIYSTYLGGGSSERGNAIAVDAAGDAYITGFTTSTDFPIKSALQPTFSGGSANYNYDAFVTELDAGGQQFVYSTYLGGNNDESGDAIAVDAAGNAYVTGYTSSTNFPIKNALQPTIADGDSDAFVTKLNAGGRQFVYSTYLGGSSSENGYGIAVDSAGNVYITGRTGSADFPTTNALQPTFNGGYTDAFVAKIFDSGGNSAGSSYSK